MTLTVQYEGSAAHTCTEHVGCIENAILHNNVHIVEWPAHQEIANSAAAQPGRNFQLTDNRIEGLQVRVSKHRIRAQEREWKAKSCFNSCASLPVDSLSSCCSASCRIASTASFSCCRVGNSRESSWK